MQNRKIYRQVSEMNETQQTITMEKQYADSGERPLHGGCGSPEDIKMDFSANLNPLGMPACAKRAVIESADAWQRYPDPYCRSLREALAAHFSCSAQRIVIGNGADDLIFRIAAAFRPAKALVPAPSFSEYEKALRQSGADVVHYTLRQEDSFNITRDIMSTIDTDIDMVFLCSPNNPTGRLISLPMLEDIAMRCEENGAFLIVDESFLPFTSAGDGSGALRLMECCRDLIVLRSFTKIFAVPGLRLGYCICGRSSDARNIANTGQYWSVSAPALAAGEAVLKDPETMVYIKQTQDLIARERAYLQQELTQAAITLIPSDANFLLCYSEMPLYERLAAEGILIRDCANFRGLSEGWFRIAVRTHEENAQLMTCIKDLIHVDR